MLTQIPVALLAAVSFGIANAENSLDPSPGGLALWTRLRLRVFFLGYLQFHMRYVQ